MSEDGASWKEMIGARMNGGFRPKAGAFDIVNLNALAIVLHLRIGTCDRPAHRRRKSPQLAALAVPYACR